MFRRLSNSLPKDPEFPADIQKLGYFINENDQIRSLTDPTQDFHYFISKNERVLEMQREAMDACIRTNLSPRFHAIGLEITRLPTDAGPDDPHIPILTTHSLAKAQRVILYLGEMNQDLGVFAYRTVGRESIAAGSVLNFAAEAMKQGTDVAVVIANIGQSLWNRRRKQAMTLKTWHALPRKTGVAAGVRIGDGNKVPGHESKEAHVKSVFGYIEQTMRKEAKVEVVGICEGIETGVRFLDANWQTWKGKVAAIAIGIGYLWNLKTDLEDQELKVFMGKRARGYLIHGDPADTPLHGRKQMGCNVFSSGESQYTECIMPRAYKAILDFLQLVNEVPNYEEPTMLSEMHDDIEPNRGTVEYIRGSEANTAGDITFSMPTQGSVDHGNP